MTKARLLEYRDLMLEWKQLADDLAELESIMFAPRIGASDGTPRSTAGGNPLENMVMRHTELQERYRAKLAEADAAIAEIERAIESLPPRERKLMRHRYIEALEWEVVCEKMSYSWRQVHRIHRQALTRLVECEEKSTEA